MRAWLQACRIQSLAIAAISVAAGAAEAWWEGHWSPVVLLALVTAVAAQAGTNLINVSYNYKAGFAPRAGAHVDPRGSSAPVRHGVLSAAQVRRGAFAVFAVSAASGIAVAMLVDRRLAWLGAPGLLAGYLYGAPPFRLAYRAFGVLTVFAFFGLAMVAGTHLIAAGNITRGTWLVATAIGLTAAGVMHTNDLRDYDGDVAHGKRTLATIIGRWNALWLLVAMDVGAYVAVGAGVVMQVLPWTTFAVILSAPEALREVRVAFRERDPRKLNVAWFVGVRLHTTFGVLLVAGLIGARLLDT